MATIYLIRHGQAQFGLEDYDALSPLGIEQAKYLGEVLKFRNTKVNKVFSGNMKRHMQTAQNCLASLCIPDFEINELPEWNEFDHREILARYDVRYKDINELKSDIISASNPKQKIQEVLTGAVLRWTTGTSADYNETWDVFCERIKNGLQKILTDSKKDELILVFTSGGSISVALKQVLGLSIEKTFDLQLLTANASITRIKTAARGLQLLSFNDYSHFEGDKQSLLSFR